MRGISDQYVRAYACITQPNQLVCPRSFRNLDKRTKHEVTETTTDVQDDDGHDGITMTILIFRDIEEDNHATVYYYIHLN